MFTLQLPGISYYCATGNLKEKIVQRTPATVDPGAKRKVSDIRLDPYGSLSKINIFSKLKPISIAHQHFELFRVEDFWVPEPLFTFDSLLQAAKHPVGSGIEVEDKLPPF